RRQKGRRLGGKQARERTLWQILRDCRPSRHQGGTCQLSRNGRAGHGQERLRLDGGKPGPHSGGVDQAIREQGTSEEVTVARAVAARATPSSGQLRPLRLKARN